MFTHHFFFLCISHQWARASSCTRFIDHTQRRTTVSRTPLDEWPARRRDLYLKTHNTHNRQTSMPPLWFEPTISAGERPQTYALDSAATGTGSLFLRKRKERHNMRSGNLQDFLNHPTSSKILVFLVEKFIQNRRLDVLEWTADRLKPGGQLGHPTLRRRFTQGPRGAR